MPDKLLSPECGLSKSKLEECTENPSDVMNGKTFYSGDKSKKNGSLDLSGSAEGQWVLQGSTFFANSTTRRTGTLVNKTLNPDARYASDNTTPVIFGDAYFSIQIQMVYIDSVFVIMGILLSLQRIHYLVFHMQMYLEILPSNMLVESMLMELSMELDTI